MRAIKGRRGSNPVRLESADEIWALGQHHGLATPLLDWTESPFVAAYFAFREKDVSNEPSDARFIYALSRDIWRWGPADSLEGKPYDRFIRFVNPLSDENPRLLNQKGLFTLPMSDEISIEHIVPFCYATDSENTQRRIIFVRIKIHNFDRENCLRNLNRMNINHATLFPDLTGAGDYCNVKLEIENYD